MSVLLIKNNTVAISRITPTMIINVLFDVILSCSSECSILSKAFGTKNTEIISDGNQINTVFNTFSIFIFKNKSFAIIGSEA